MTNAPFVDIHAHHLLSQADVITVYNHNYDEAGSNHGDLFSASVHPWNLPSTIDEWSTVESKLIALLSERACLALGEIGLDRLTEVSWSLQVDYFTKLIRFALDQQVRTLILHSVKAHHSCLDILKHEGYDATIIFHDYHGSWQETRTLLQRPHTFLSLGAVLSRPQSKLFTHLSELPLDKLFLETDAHKETIEQRYQLFCSLTGHDELAVRRQFHYNLTTLTEGMPS